MAQQSFVLLCALATVVLLACGSRPRDLAWTLGGLVLGLALLVPVVTVRPLVDFVPGQVALLLALLAFGRLRGGLPIGLLCGCGGLMAVVWYLGLASLGYPRLLALFLVLLASLVAAHGALRRPEFSPARLLDDASVLLLIAGLAQLLLPEVVDGWRAATGLQAAATEQAHEVAVGPLLLVGACLLAGVLAAVWRGRRAASIPDTDT